MYEFRVPTQLPDWIQDHVRRYLESAGEDGHMWTPPMGGDAVPTLLLVTKGRKSGNLQTLPLIYGEADGGYIIVGSKGGAPTDPAWLLNIRANPEVAIQVGAERFEAVARVVPTDQRDRLWRVMTQIYPDYDEYAQRAKREIPIVVLERRPWSQPPSRPLPSM